MQNCSIQNYNFINISKNKKYNYSTFKSIAITDTVTFSSNSHIKKAPKKIFRDIIIKPFTLAGWLSDIFRREISEEEATKLLAQYKKLIFIENKEEYIKQLFNQLKKDFGWENIDFTYQLCKSNVDGNSMVNGGFRPLFPVVKSLPDRDFTIEKFIPEIIVLRTDMNKKDIFITLFHEFQHCKQHELAYRIDKKKFIDALIKNRFAKIEKTQEIVDIIDKYKAGINKYYAPEWDKMPPLQKNSKEYKLGLKYINNIANYIYIDENKKEYRKQVLERDAGIVDLLAGWIYKKALKSK